MTVHSRDRPAHWILGVPPLPSGRDVEVIVELQERFPHKLGLVVSDDGVGHPKTVHYVTEESCDLR